MTVKQQYQSWTCSDDLDREVRRLALFGIEVRIGGLGRKPSDRDANARPVAFFYPKIDEPGWVIHCSPTATKDEELHALDTAWAVITNPETHPWWRGENGPTLRGERPDYGVTITAPRHPSRDAFARALAKQVEELLLVELLSSTPTMLGAYEGSPKPFTHDEHFTRRGWEQLSSHLQENAEIIAGEVRAEMARQGRETGELADLLNLTPGTVRRSLKGYRAFREAEMRNIAEWLEVDIEDLLTTPHGSQPVTSELMPLGSAHE